MSKTSPRPHHLSPSIETVRAVWIYKDFSPPSTVNSLVGLGLTCEATARCLRLQGIQTEIWGARSAEALNQKLTAHAGDKRPITHVFIGACWINGGDLEVLAETHREIVFTVINHSTISFLHADPNGVRNLRATMALSLKASNVSMAGNNRKFSDWASKAYGAPVELLQNLYNLQNTLRRPRMPWAGHLFRGGCFGAFRPWKNINTAAAAVLEMRERLDCDVEFHVNGGDAAVNSILTSIQEMFEGVRGATLVRHGWLSWPSFLGLCRTMDVCFQPSYTETFNQVAADALREGVPTVVSDAIEWTPRNWVAHFDDASDVASTGVRLLHDPSAVDEGLKSLKIWNDATLPQWTGFLLRVR